MTVAQEFGEVLAICFAGPPVSNAAPVLPGADGPTLPACACTATPSCAAAQQLPVIFLERLGRRRALSEAQQTTRQPHP
eukprot:CAMPEP_0202384998 /NCGR_PEP_ID=MMETSP1127-20130417/58282_1 /ASSEMBLY_ACC=CAM_ASM_000462 /TAXON_ID=3047 /ORGANISM="Dunaliella tertiolecta, Strain CCMP1320" /LENGTH=78 /DNA_ID=CAMNT_0048985007 /DNA_START=432 /DNA_END=664 /DNA_ORIENTATION=+